MAGHYGMARQRGFRRLLRREVKPQSQIIWLSDHELYEEQKNILLTLYGNNTPIVHYQGVEFRRQDDLVDFLERHQDDVVFVVAPKAQLIEATIAGLEKGLSFGYFTFDRGARHHPGVPPIVKSVYYFDGRARKLYRLYVRSNKKSATYSVARVK